MNYANLEILGISAPTGIDNYYDDGFVESILEHKLKLNKRYRISNSNGGIKISKECVGMHSEYDHIFYQGIFRYLNKHHHIFYIKQPTEIGDIRVRAHEETHVLDVIGGLDILEEKLLEKQRVRINFKEIDEKEVKASLGALYALHARGIFQLEIGLLYMMYRNGDGGTTAIKIYKQSKLPRKRFFLF